jgi:hypothetical protein
MVEEDNQTRLMPGICNSLKLFKESVRKPSLLPISPCSSHGGFSNFLCALCVAQISIPSAINTAQRGDRYDHLGQKYCLSVEFL